MTVAERILQHLQRLPESLQGEVLHFVQFLESKANRREELYDQTEWAAFSLSSAMRGMEDEELPYTVRDLKESYQ